MAQFARRHEIRIDPPEELKSSQMIKYIGSKRLLVPLITDVVRSLNVGGTVVDLFSGTSRVGYALKENGHRVLANDMGSYAAVLARCLVQADREDVIEQVRRSISDMATVPGRAGYFTETFCERSRYFSRGTGSASMRCVTGSQTGSSNPKSKLRS